MSTTFRHSCRVWGLDTGAKKLSVKFPGSEKLNYDVHVIYRTKVNNVWINQKRISGGNIKLNAVFKITNISPTTVSSTGGTKITITGEGFNGADKLDN